MKTVSNLFRNSFISVGTPLAASHAPRSNYGTFDSGIVCST